MSDNRAQASLDSLRRFAHLVGRIVNPFGRNSIPSYKLAVRTGGSLVFLLVFNQAAWGQEATDDVAVESARSALRDSGSYPWYDRQNDDVRRIKVKPPKTRNATNWNLNFGFFSGGDWFTPLAWMGIAVLLGAIIYLLVRAYLLREKRSAADAAGEDDGLVSESVDRVEDLPVKIRRPRSDLLSEAREQYLAGNYGEAIIYLYSHLLVQLDKRDLIRLTKGKTNRQYLREVSSWDGLRRLLEQAMVLFEDVFFGNHRLQREHFESVWNRLDEFDNLLEEANA